MATKSATAQQSTAVNIPSDCELSPREIFTSWAAGDQNKAMNASFLYGSFRTSFDRAGLPDLDETSSALTWAGNVTYSVSIQLSLQEDMQTNNTVNINRIIALACR